MEDVTMLQPIGAAMHIYSTVLIKIDRKSGRAMALVAIADLMPLHVRTCTIGKMKMVHLDEAIIGCREDVLTGR